jgi:Family of unknown function (DUF6677)
MANYTAKIPSATQPGQELEIQLKDRRLAAFLAWLFPGLGHFYQGRTGKGVLFLVCIFGTFLYGLYLGEGRVVYASTTPGIFSRWQYYCQLGVGLPALPAIVQARRAKAGLGPLFGIEWMRPPKMFGDFGEFRSTDNSGNEVISPDELAKWNHDLADRFEMGTVYTVIAGLLNLLVIYDAYGGPLVIPHEEKKKQPDAQDKK